VARERPSLDFRALTPEGDRLWAAPLREAGVAGPTAAVDRRAARTLRGALLAPSLGTGAGAARWRAPAPRAVASALGAAGCAQTAPFHRYRRVLSHARLALLVATCAPDGPRVLGLAETRALARRELWRHQLFHTSSCGCELRKVPRALIGRMTETLWYVV
jgi:hypothetical protein